MSEMLEQKGQYPAVGFQLVYCRRIGQVVRAFFGRRRFVLRRRVRLPLVFSLPKVALLRTGIPLLVFLASDN